MYACGDEPPFAHGHIHSYPQPMTRYSLTGPNSTQSAPRWYRPAVDPAAIRKLMEKSDARATRDTAMWLGLMALFAAIAITLMPSWWSLPFWLAYGVLYGSGADSRWHECGHQTAFRTGWMNTVTYHIASFMMMRNPYTWRASHVRHHTDTIIPGRDPEIVAMRPPDLIRIALNLFGLLDTAQLITRMALHATGRVTPEEATYIRPQDRTKITRAARIWLAIYALTIATALATSSWIPLLLVGLPRLYGAWHHVLTGLLQHLGLAENVSDHRLNTRTVLMNPVSRFIYLNMNYHLEHHLFTMVPYYNLPALHALIKHDLPTPEPSITAAFHKLLPVLLKQLSNENAVLIPPLPKGATPYSAEVDHLRAHAI